MPETKKGFVARIDSTQFALGHPELWKFIKSNAAGLLGALPGIAAQLTLLPLLSKYSLALPDMFFFRILAGSLTATAYTIEAVVYAFIISTLIGQVLGFVLNRKVAFHADSNVALGTFLMILLALFTILANGFVGPAITAVLLKILPEGFGLNLLSKLLSMTATIAWCYPVNRFIIHRKKKEVSTNV